jgi:hypothetical protein
VSSDTAAGSISGHDASRTSRICASSEVAASTVPRTHPSGDAGLGAPFRWRRLYVLDVTNPAPTDTEQVIEMCH